jgi:cytochrome oxidase Cu insertion factor (SCO1/SenC/PrrC family)/cytochrome c2
MWRAWLIAAVILVGQSVLSPITGLAEQRRWGEGYFPNLPVVTQEGQTLRFYDDVVKGRIVVISFIYTSCTDVCPLTTARFSQVAEELGDRVGRDIFLVTITVDPERDTPARLKSYAQAFHAGPGWLFLTGTLEDIRAINVRLGERMRSLNEHRNEIVLGNDVTGEWARNSLFGDLTRLVIDIKSMDPRWRESGRTAAHDAAADTGYQLSKQPGQALFKRLCAACHTIKVGDRVGPDLFGVGARHRQEWLVEFIMSPEKLRARNDPKALELAARFPGVRMPSLGLSEDDARDLIAYIGARSDWLESQRRNAEQSHPAQHHHHKDHRH